MSSIINQPSKLCRHLLDCVISSKSDISRMQLNVTTDVTYLLRILYKDKRFVLVLQKKENFGPKANKSLISTQSGFGGRRRPLSDLDCCEA